MTISMMAIGAGNGKDKANAIDFNWDGTYIHEANTTSWHCIQLSNLNKEAEDPTVALYLTNLANETANVELSGSAVLKFPFPISVVVKDIDLLQYVGNDATETYSIEGKKHVVWTMPTTYDLSAIAEGQAKDALSELFGDLTNVSLIQLVEYGLSNVYLQVSSNKQIAIAADVYETAEIVDDACTKAVDFNWAGETVEAGTRAVTIAATCDWRAVSNDAWISVSPDSGDRGIHEVILSFSENTTGAVRHGSVTFSAGSYSETFKLTQNAK